MERCRICLKSSAIIRPLMGKIGNMVGDILQISISASDGFPQNICNKCYSIVLSAHELRILAAESHSLLFARACTINKSNSSVRDEVMMECYTDSNDITIKEESITERIYDDEDEVKAEAHIEFIDVSHVKKESCDVNNADESEDEEGVDRMENSGLDKHRQMECRKDFAGEVRNEDFHNPPSVIRRRGSNRIWLLVKKYDVAKEAENDVWQENTWSNSSTKHTTKGTKVEYRCNKGTYRYNECPSGLYLLYHSESSHVSMFKTDAEHQHDNRGNVRGLSEEMKNFIKNKFEKGVEKPSPILALIRKANLTEPPEIKVIHYLKMLRRTKYVRPSISSVDITEWCEEKSEIPVDEDTPFVLQHFIQCNSPDVDKKNIKIFISSKRLLKNMTYSQLVQIDSTNKLMWQGYSIFLIGTSDENQMFHPIGLGVCGNETESDFKFMFESLKKYNSDWNPRILLADGNAAITQGFANVFGAPETRLVCFLHVLQSAEKLLKQIKEKNAIKGDINTLQMCKSEEFKMGVPLFLKKWEADENAREFVDYFKKQWFDKNECWYAGAAAGYPSTNVGIEATNNVIRKEHMFRERYPAGQFLNVMFKIVKNWSSSRNPELENSTKFSSVRTIPLKEWIDGYQWAISNKKIIKEEKEDFFLFYTNTSQFKNELISDLFKTYHENYGKWETFDSFQKCNFSVWIVRLDKHNVNSSFCTCPYYLNHASCKHLLGIKIRCKLVEVPREAKSFQLGQKRKRGRPPKT